ncbi:MAG: flippase-like domain-containing protein [Acidimicrobiales bacterium]|nr:flippase-like domain-containing protein [Acidimicrobiales bacterium]
MTSRRAAVLGGRVAVSVAMLAFLLTRLPHRDTIPVWPGWSGHTVLWLGGALVLVAASMVLSTLRWQQVLATLGVRERVRHLLSHYLAGQFVGNVLPTTIGGDVLRVSRLAKDTGEAPRPFASVVLERLTGWVVLPLITLFALLVNPGLRELGTASAVAAALAVGTLLLLGVVLAAAASRHLGGRLAQRDNWLRFVGAVHLGVARFRQRPAAAVNVLVVGLAYQLVMVGAALMAAEAIGIRVGLGPTAALAFVPAVMIGQVLPVGISGLGIREGLLVLFLTPLGVPTEQAIALGLILYALNLVVSLLGAPAFALAPHRKRPAVETPA